MFNKVVITFEVIMVQETTLLSIKEINEYSVQNVAVDIDSFLDTINSDKILVKLLIGSSLG